MNDSRPERCPEPRGEQSHPSTPSPADAQTWTPQQIAALGAVTDLPTAAAILGISRTTAYDLARRGQFPVPVLKAGTRYRVPVAPLAAALHLPNLPRPPARPSTQVSGPGLDAAATASIDHHQESQAHRCPVCGHTTAPTGAPTQEGHR